MFPESQERQHRRNTLKESEGFLFIDDGNLFSGIDKQDVRDTDAVIFDFYSLIQDLRNDSYLQDDMFLTSFAMRIPDFNRLEDQLSTYGWRVQYGRGVRVFLDDGRIWYTFFDWEEERGQVFAGLTHDAEGRYHFSFPSYIMVFTNRSLSTKMFSMFRTRYRELRHRYEWYRRHRNAYQ